jgi:hypothetical protein
LLIKINNKNTWPLLDCLDFTSFENKEGRGSLYDRHRERVRSVDKLIGKWDGTGQGQVKERGKDMNMFTIDNVKQNINKI